MFENFKLFEIFRFMGESLMCIWKFIKMFEFWGINKCFFEIVFIVWGWGWVVWFEMIILCGSSGYYSYKYLLMGYWLKIVISKWL